MLLRSLKYLFVVLQVLCLQQVHLSTKMPINSSNFFQSVPCLSSSMPVIIIPSDLNKNKSANRMQETTLLGSYQQRDYSQGFQKMMNNVVQKIYKKKGIKQNILKTLIEFSPRESLIKRPVNKYTYFEEINQRKNSSPVPSYSLSLPKTNGFVQRHERNRYSISSHKMLDLQGKRKGKYNKKCLTFAHNDIQQSLYKKISEYNTCLMARTYRFQEKEKQAVFIDRTDRRETLEESPPTISKIKRCENSKRNNRWINSKGKFLLQGSPLSPKTQEFEPWEIDHLEQIQY